MDTPGMDSGPRAPSSWQMTDEDDEGDDMDFVVEELADTDEEEDELSDEGTDSGSDLAYEPESEFGGHHCCWRCFGALACIEHLHLLTHSTGGWLEEETEDASGLQQGSLQQSHNTGVGGWKGGGAGCCSTIPEGPRTC